MSLKIILKKETKFLLEVYQLEIITYKFFLLKEISGFAFKEYCNFN